MHEVHIVGIAEAKVAMHQEVLVSYALGSCVGVCLYDAKLCMAGMVHILLPYQRDSHAQENEYKFADSGIRQLIQLMLSFGAKQNRLTAKIAGGADMLQVNPYLPAIGTRNVCAVKEILSDYHIPIIAEDTGNNYGRSIWFYAETGQLQIKSVHHRTEFI